MTDENRYDDLEELQKRMIAIPPARRKKIEEIKRRLQGGTYTIDTTAVARSLLKEQCLNEVLWTA
jgi:flagellar biosynthesis anti-sigma factor FlgM